MENVGIHKAKTQLSKLINKALNGEEIIISKNGTPVVKLTPLKKQRKKRIAGQDRGKVWVADDFDAPLPPEIQKYFE